MAAYAGEKTYNSDIVLSGSLFQNERLYYLISGVLKQVGFRVHTPAEIPLNGAGLCVGQAYYAGEYFF